MEQCIQTWPLFLSPLFSYFPMNATTSEVYIQIDEFVYNFPPKQERKKYQNDFSCNAKFMRREFVWKGATFLNYNVFRIQKNDAIFFRHFERVLSSVEEKNHIENIRWIFQYVRPLFYWNHVNNFSIIKCQRMMKQDSFCRYFVVYFYLDALNKSSSQWNFFSFCFFSVAIQVVTFAAHFHDFAIMTNCLCSFSFICSLNYNNVGVEDKKKNLRTSDGDFARVTINNEPTFFLFDFKKTHLLLARQTKKKHTDLLSIATDWN